jgi:ABC-type molybdate transport system substrate-binding protein
MKKQTCTLVIVLVASVLLRERFAAQQRDLHVVATFGIQGVMERILPEYQRNSGQNVSIDYEESAVIQQQVASGKVFDLAILVPQVIDELINTGQLKLARGPISRKLLSGSAFAPARPGMISVRLKQ